MKTNDSQEQVNVIYEACNTLFSAVMFGLCMLSFAAGQILICLGQILVLASGQQNWEDLQEGNSNKRKK